MNSWVWSHGCKFLDGFTRFGAMDGFSPYEFIGFPPGIIGCWPPQAAECRERQAARHARHPAARAETYRQHRAADQRPRALSSWFLETASVFRKWCIFRRWSILDVDVIDVFKEVVNSHSVICLHLWQLPLSWFYILVRVDFLGGQTGRFATLVSAFVWLS